MSNDGPMAALRRLATLTDAQLTAFTGVREAEAERDARSWRRCIEPFGLRADRKENLVRPQEGETASLFLFSGDVASFNIADLMPLAFGLDEARAGLVLPESQEGFQRRAGFKVVPPPRSSATEAALQGYGLARQVRTAIGDPTGPLADLATQAEHQLCVPVRGAGFQTRRLRAAAVRDVNMGAAAILVNTSVTDARLLRVAIAHELCHVMFDPSGARVALTMDELSTGPTSERAENRARAFAAELLAPRAGLVVLIGRPGEVAEAIEARALVDEARAHFQVSLELATWHLTNHRYITKVARDEMLRARTDRSTPNDASPPREVRAIAESKQRATNSQSTAKERIGAIELAAERSVRELLAAKAIALGDRPLDLAVELGRRFDQALESGEHAKGLALLTLLDPRAIPGDTSSGFLGYVKPRCLALGGEWHDAYRSTAIKAVKALAEVWNWEAEDVADAATGLLA
jgi:Zn-dependent peptidase ImmA (M78 family)